MKKSTAIMLLPIFLVVEIGKFGFMVLDAFINGTIDWMIDIHTKIKEGLSSKKQESNCTLNISHTFPCDYEYGCETCPENRKNQ